MGCSKRLFYGLLGCLGGLFIQLVVGSVYQWGIINIYITSYYKTLDPNVTLQANVVAFPVMMICIGFTMRLGLFFATLTHPIISLSVVVLIQAGLIFSSSYVPSFGVFIVVYGVLFGLCSGLNFMTPIVECNLYFPGKKMYVNGFILMGTGLGPLVFGVFAYNFLNPMKLPPSQGYYYGTQQLQAIAKKVPECLKWLSLLYLLIGLTGVALLAKVCIQNRRVQKEEKRKKQEEQKATNEKQNRQSGKIIRPITMQNFDDKDKNKRIGESIENIIEQKSQQIDKKQVKIQAAQQNQQKNNLHPQNGYENILESPKKIHSTQQNILQNTVQTALPPKNLCQVIKTKIFWIKLFIVLFTTCGLYLINGNYKTYVKSVISDDEFLTTIGVIASVGNGCSRFFWNMLFNKTGYRFVMSVNIVIQIIVYSIIRFTVYTRGVYLFLVFLINCCIGEVLVVTPTFAQIIFGQILGSQVYGFYWTTYGISNFIQFGYVSGLSNLISFNGIIYICLGMSVFAGILVTFCPLKAAWDHPVDQLSYFKCCNKSQDGQQQKK